MKALVCLRYGPPEVLTLTEWGKPTPRDNEVLIRVRATTVTPAECLMRSGASPVGRAILGFTKPQKKYQILGLELAGTIEAVGGKVTRFKVGDEVFGFTGFSPGAYAEYKCMPETGALFIKPANLSHAEAAALVDGASTAWFFLKDKGRIKSGDKVLINGASGSIGTYAVQFAKHFGAQVTGVCGAANVELVRSLGADRVIDYTQEDFTTSGVRYDIIFDTVAKSSFSRCKEALEPNGRYLVTVMGFLPIIQTVWTRLVGGKRAIFAMSIEKREALGFIKELAEKGALKPIIDRTYPLEQGVEAHRYVAGGHKKGNVVLTIG